MPYEPEKEEQRLVENSLKGDSLSQKKLFEKYYAKMLSTCIRYANHRDDALDMCQEGFIKVFANLQRYEFTSPLEAWIRRIMVNNCIDHFRKSKVRPSFVEVDEAYSISTGETISAQLSADEIMNLIQKLPAGYRMVFNLFAIDGLTHREIAEQLGISEGTSKSQLSKAREVLQKLLHQLEKKTSEY